MTPRNGKRHNTAKPRDWLKVRGLAPETRTAIRTIAAQEDRPVAAMVRRLLTVAVAVYREPGTWAKFSTPETNGEKARHD